MEFSLTLVKHILPFRIKISESSDVLFPRFDARIVVLHILVIIVIFISKTGEAMAELMHYHWFECRVVSSGKRFRLRRKYLYLRELRYAHKARHKVCHAYSSDAMW